MILGSYLTIRKWCPDFDPEAGVVASTLVWAGFPNLPVEYFRESTLMKCGNLIGKQLKWISNLPKPLGVNVQECVSRLI